MENTETTADERNAATSLAEIADILVNRPARIFGYCSHVEVGATITTWTGEAYGRITSVGRPFHSNFDDRRQSFRCKIADSEYSGFAYPDSGDYVRLRKIASSSR